MVNRIATLLPVRSLRCNEGFQRVRFVKVCSALAVLALSAGGCNAQSSALLVSPALARFLTLSNDQIQTLAAQHKAWRAELGQADKAARKLTSSADRGELCAQLRGRESQVQEASRSVLNSGQQQALAQLSNAFSQMPLIEAAQRLELIDAGITAVPASFPDGSIDVEFRYVRAVPAVLPGCKAKPSQPFNTQQREDKIQSPTR